MRKSRGSRETREAGQCAICNNVTANGYGLLSKYGSSSIIICPNCLVNSDAKEAKQARLELGR